MTAQNSLVYPGESAIDPLIYANLHKSLFIRADVYHALAMAKISGFLSLAGQPGALILYRLNYRDRDGCEHFFDDGILGFL